MIQLDNPIVQGALIAFVATAIGALVGAMGSLIVARSNRQAARDGRLEEKLLTTAEDLATKGSRHLQALANQFGAVQARAEERPTDLADLPELTESTDPLEDLVNTLYLVAKQRTGEAAEAFYQGLVNMNASYAYDVRKRAPEGILTTLTDEQVKIFGDDRTALVGLKTDFMDAVRGELGRRTLVPRSRWRRFLAAGVSLMNKLRHRTAPDPSAAWDKKMEGVPIANAATAPFVIDALEAQLDRALSASKSTDDKAALVIPAIGLIVGIVAPGVKVGLDGIAMWFAIGAAACGIISGLLAVGALAPWWKRSNGPDPERAVRGAAEPVETARSNYLRSLGFAVASTTDQVWKKSFVLNASLTVAAAGIVLVILLAAAGGIE
jgi:hypothetical protein